MSDLDDLKALLDRWAVPYEHTTDPDEFSDEAAQAVWVGTKHDPYAIPKTTRVDGYGGFYTQYEFTRGGAFVKMGAWE